MKLTNLTIIQQYFHRFQAEVSMAAHSLTVPGFTSKFKPEFYRFWLIRDGGGRLTIDGRGFELQPGQLYILPPNVEQIYEAAPNQTLSFYWCNFRAAIGDMELFDLLNLPIYVMLEVEDQESLTQLFERLIEAYRSRLLTRELRIRAGMYAIMAVYLEYCGIDEHSITEVEQLEKINRVLEYIEAHLSEPIAIEDLARTAYLHPNYFIGYFKNIVGYAPGQYVNLRRLERAKRLLEDQVLSISEIAGEVGMQNHYLSRLFRQHTGLTPSRYRQIYAQLAQDPIAGEKEGKRNE